MNILEETIIYRFFEPRFKIRVWRESEKEDDIDKELMQIREVQLQLPNILKTLASCLILLPNVNAVEVVELHNLTSTPKTAKVLYKDWP